MEGDTGMSSWIHLFSKFTPEALLFEALVICCLLASYSAFWILRKRRFGAVENSIPAGVVKAYLNELIVDAEALRAQLFGLLAGAGLPAGDAAKYIAALGPAPSAPIIGPTITADPGLAAKLAVLEAKMAEQAKAMETLLLEKTRLAAELQAARAQGGGGAPGAPVEDAAAIAKLQEKIRSLEGKLDEYSVIEDDLANLKRLQQENAQLRSSLAGAPVPAPAPTAAAAPKAAEPQAAATPAPEAPKEALPPEPTLEPVATAQAPATETPFDALASEVEKSLEPAIAATATEPAAAPQAAEPLHLATTMPALEEVGNTAALPAAPAGAGASQEKSDADLVAEFEKMLNG